MAAVWDLWLDGARSPAMNMAVDQVLLETAGDRGRPLVRFYQWDRPAHSIGCFQNRTAAPPGTAFVRRPTGGGVVDHRGDFTYTVVLPARHGICRLDREASYGRINGAVIAALGALAVDARLTEQEIPDHVDRRSMVCFTHPTRYDVVVAGGKVAGAAQRRCREGILHQGSILLEFLPALARNDLARALQASFEQLFGGEAAVYEPDDTVCKAAEACCRAQFGNPDWNDRR